MESWGDLIVDTLAFMLLMICLIGFVLVTVGAYFFVASFF